MKNTEEYFPVPTWTNTIKTENSYYSLDEITDMASDLGYEYVLYYKQVYGTWSKVEIYPKVSENDINWNTISELLKNE